MPCKDVSSKKKKKNGSNSSGSVTSGLKAGNMTKKTEVENMRRKWKVMVTLKREGGHFHPRKPKKATGKRNGRGRRSSLLNT